MPDLVFYDYLSVTAQPEVDLGEVAPRSSNDLMLTVYNTSETYQANGIQVTVGGEHGDQLWVSLDGDSFAEAVDVGDVPPNAASAPFYLRRVTPSTAATGTCTATLTATPSSWSSPIDTSPSSNVGLDVGAEIPVSDIDLYDPPPPPT